MQIMQQEEKKRQEKRKIMFGLNQDTSEMI